MHGGRRREKKNEWERRMKGGKKDEKRRMRGRKGDGRADRAGGHLSVLMTTLVVTVHYDWRKGPPGPPPTTMLWLTLGRGSNLMLRLYIYMRLGKEHLSKSR